MVDNSVSKPLGLVLIVTAHVVFNGHSLAEVTGILGTNITLEFKYNVSVTEHFAVYKKTKIVEYDQGKITSNESNFHVYPKNTSVFLNITNLKLSHSGNYWASLFMGSVPKESDKVQLIIQEDNGSSTVSPEQSDITTNSASGSDSLLSPHIVIVLVVSPVVLLAALLPLLIWCLVRPKDKQQQQPPRPQQSSYPTVQETVEASNTVPAPPLVYSVLDFPKRPSAVLEMNGSDTEYAAVSYLPEKRQG